MAILALLLLAPTLAVHADAGEMRCTFAGQGSAAYQLTPDLAGVRRVDVEPARWGRVEAGPHEWRFVFDAGLEQYRIVVVIDRRTGNARRVFGAKRNMNRPYAEGRAEADGLVREAGRCELGPSLSRRE